jgi:hypothetical protein
MSDNIFIGVQNGRFIELPSTAPFLKAAREIGGRAVDIGDIEVSVAGLSSEEPASIPYQRRQLLWAARECLSFYSMAPYGGDIELKKNKYGLPYLCLSEGLSTRVRENGISRVLISSTNDSGVAFGIAAATKVSENSSTESLGIGYRPAVPFHCGGTFHRLHPGSAGANIHPK